MRKTENIKRIERKGTNELIGIKFAAKLAITVSQRKSEMTTLQETTGRAEKLPLKEK